MNIEKEEKDYCERDLNGVRINKNFPNDQDLGKIIRRDRPNFEITKKYPNDQELGREFRKIKIELFENFKRQNLEDSLL